MRLDVIFVWRIICGLALSFPDLFRGLGIIRVDQSIKMGGGGNILTFMSSLGDTDFKPCQPVIYQFLQTGFTLNFSFNYMLYYISRLQEQSW